MPFFSVSAAPDRHDIEIETRHWQPRFHNVMRKPMCHGRLHGGLIRTVCGADRLRRMPEGRTAAWDLRRWSGGTGTPARPVPLAVAAPYRLGGGRSAPP